MKTVFKHLVTKDKEGTYYKIPFDMPADMDTVYISYAYDEGTIDLGIYDSERFLGWSGSNKKTVSIGARSELGYLQTKLHKGTYYIAVGAYKIPNDNGIEVTYEIDYRPKEERWLSGDLHMHTNASDGEYDAYTLAKKAQKLGLDFISITNHNNYNENFYLPNIPGLTIIPGVEWTHYKSHMNFYGVKAPFTDFAINTEEEMQDLIQEVKDKGAIVSVNHPQEKSCGFLWKTHNYDLLEVWNGPMRPANVRSLKMWHDMLVSGKRIPIIGGSDFHRSKHPVRLGNPITRVYAKSNTYEDIIEAILAGKCYVTSSMNGPSIEMKHENNHLEVTVENAKNCTVQLITQDGVIAKFKHRKTLPVSAHWKFAYVVVRGLWIKAISNPIYFD